MPAYHRSRSLPRASLSFVLLCILLCTCWIAGGASRADELGQVVVRTVSWAVLVVAALWATPPSFKDGRPVALMLGAAVVLVLLQLVPLPPALWQALPGRQMFVDAALVSGQQQPWRPLAIVPGATANAAASLVVPAAVLLLVVGLGDAERRWLPGIVLSLIAAGMLVGLLQFSGAGFSNPLVNDTLGQVSGMFANRNHFALFLSLGCLLAPVWAFMEGGRLSWRGPVAAGLTLLFALTILATGSRTGIALGAFGLVIGLVVARARIKRLLSGYPRWVPPVMIVGLLGILAACILVSVAADRAVSISRVMAVDPAQDMRSRGLATVLQMIGTYFPFGSGLGGFDPVFRIHEPFALLKPTYFNHAHNDFLEIALDAGLPGLLLLMTVLVWWMRASVRAWRAGPGMRHAIPKLGSAMLFLVMIASLLDYPARTPMMMALIVVASYWLAGRDGASGPALPVSDQHL